MLGLMTKDELVADLRRRIVIDTKYVDGIKYKSFSFGKYSLLVAPFEFDELLFSVKGNMLRDVKEVALQKAFREAIAETAKSEWGIEFNPEESDEKKDN